MSMAKTIHLVRHGHHPHLGIRLCGRMPGVEIDETGRREIAQCCELIRAPVAHIQSSPQRRAIQSAGVIAARFGGAIEIVPDMDEIDMGDWTSLSFEDLGRDTRWAHWNSRRASARPPGGESMRKLQRRIVSHLQRLCNDASDGTIVIVSHAEPIRAALLHYLGISLNDFLSVDVQPGSISTLHAAAGSIEVAHVNRKVLA
jgi:probable phosphoglycerate mutase